MSAPAALLRLATAPAEPAGAHGQGYSDLSCLIPELVEGVLGLEVYNLLDERADDNVGDHPKQ